MKLRNSLSKHLEDVKPLDGKTVRIYSCGPTLYDRIHIGNLSSFIFADTLRRAIKLNGYDVRQVMNFTDVDDKTIKKSQEENDNNPNKALELTTKKYESLFLKDFSSVGNTDVEFVRATDYVKQMQELISELYRKGIAYAADDGVYFSIAKYKETGKKYGQLTEITSSSTAESRINNDEYDKDSAQDFALWKVQKPGEPSWGFVLDGHSLTGRPGWHIECSAMSRAELGQPFDIHTGGIDLIFPHHENEIAQSTAATESPVLATIFAHNEHLLIDGRKMSKSLNNFYTLDDISKKGYEPLAFRLLVLQAHYSSQLNFTWGSLEASKNRLKELRAWADLRYQGTTDKTTPELDALFNKTKEDILEALSNDLNTPQAMSALSKLVSYMQDTDIPGEDRLYTNGFLNFIDEAFGLHLATRVDITDEQKKLIRERLAARESNNFDESDRFRDLLLKQGLALKDTVRGTFWSRVDQ